MATWLLKETREVWFEVEADTEEEALSFTEEDGFDSDDEATTECELWYEVVERRANT
jgi:hypothetical protein